MDNQIKTSEAITIRYITEDAQRLRAEANALKKLDCHMSSLQNRKCRMENVNSGGMLKDFLIL